MANEEKNIYRKNYGSNMKMSNMRSNFSEDAIREEEQAQAELEAEKRKQLAHSERTKSKDYFKNVKSIQEKNIEKINKSNKKSENINTQIDILKDKEKLIQEQKEKLKNSNFSPEKLKEKEQALERKEASLRNDINTLKRKQEKINSKSLSLKEKEAGRSWITSSRGFTADARYNDAKNRNYYANETLKHYEQERTNILTNKKELEARLSNNEAKLKSLESKTDAKSISERNKIQKEQKNLSKELAKNNKTLNKNNKKVSKFTRITEKTGLKETVTRCKKDDTLVKKTQRVAKKFTKKTFNASKEVAGKAWNSKPVLNTRRKVSAKFENTKAGKRAKKAKELAKSALKNTKKLGEAVGKAAKAAKEGIKKALNQIGAALRNGIMHVLGVVFGNPVSIVIICVLAAFLLLCIFGMVSSTITYNASDDDTGDVITDDDIRQLAFKEWVAVYKEPSEMDSETPFYDKYRQTISADKIAVVSYVYRDPEKLEEIFWEFFAEQASRDTKEEYENVYQAISEKYYPYAADKTALRMLYLDYLDYNFSYLRRTYTDWSFSRLPDQPIDEDEIDSLQQKVVDEAYSHDEILEKTSKINYYHYEPVDDYGWVEVTTCPDNYKDESECTTEDEWQKTGFHWEKELKTTEITTYKFRDIERGSEIWTSAKDPSVPFISEKVKEGYETPRDSLIATDWMPTVAEKDVDWTEIYADKSGYITKRTKFWQLKKWDNDSDEDQTDVIDLIVYKYNPTENYSAHEEYQYSTVDISTDGDIMTFKITSLLDAKDSTEYTIDKKQIYPVCYSESAMDYIDIDKYFDENNIDVRKEELVAYQKMFAIYVNGIDFQFTDGKWILYPYIIASEGKEMDNYKIVQDFNGTFSSSFAGQGYHGALDIAWGKGTDVNCAISGEVITVVDKYPDYPTGFSGGPGDVGRANHIIVKSEMEDTAGQMQTIITWYYHIAQNSVSANGIKAGDYVEAGQKIAEEGHNGWSTGSHTHFEVFVGEAASGNQIDPEQYMMFTTEE